MASQMPLGRSRYPAGLIVVIAACVGCLGSTPVQEVAERIQALGSPLVADVVAVEADAMADGAVEVTLLEGATRSDAVGLYCREISDIIEAVDPPGDFVVDVLDHRQSSVLASDSTECEGADS
jgi:hypothetical protein